ncbi:hypothetical protein HKX48_003890 [Thoreauomyces humboldtii]|nr:hypothetical protein HKX48_003890 [Thoreauomyces humboldtii]
MLAGTEFERMLGVSPMDWDITSIIPNCTKQVKAATKRSRTIENVPTETRKRKSQNAAPPSLGRLKMALLQREQDILKQKDDSPYPTPIEESSNSLLLKTQSSFTSTLAPTPQQSFPQLRPVIDILHQRAAEHGPQEAMVLSYFYMYLDLSEDRHTHLSAFNLQLERHQLGLLADVDASQTKTVEMATVCHDRFPRLVEMCERGIRADQFMLIKLNLDLSLLLPGDFRNISVLQTARPRAVQCTTTVYHFGARILETKEIQYPNRREGDNVSEAAPMAASGRSLYHFDFVPRFFSTFLAGLQCFEMEIEKRIAVDNLSVVQVRDRAHVIC